MAVRTVITRPESV